MRLKSLRRFAAGFFAALRMTHGRTVEGHLSPCRFGVLQIVDSHLIYSSKKRGNHGTQKILPIHHGHRNFPGLICIHGHCAGVGCSSTITVHWGDTLSGLAATCGTSMDAIRAANPGLGWWVYAGQVLYIPSGSTSTPVYTPTVYTSTAGGTYAVQWGDTLGIIAGRMGGEVSDRQWRDVLGVLKTKTGKLDLDYLHKWAKELKVSDLLERALKEST